MRSACRITGADSCSYVVRVAVRIKISYIKRRICKANAQLITRFQSNLCKLIRKIFQRIHGYFRSLNFVSVGILFGGIRGLLPSIRTSLEQSFGGIINGWGIALLVLLVVVQVAVSVLQIYLSCSIGHLFRRKRILFAVLFYYAINVVLETVAVTSIIVLSNFEPFCRFLVQLSAGMSAPGMFNLFIGVMLALLAVLGIVYFFVTERILRRHLNLE